MQPEPSQVSNSETVQELALESTLPSQHGQPVNDRSTSPTSLHRGDRVDGEQEVLDADTAIEGAASTRPELPDATTSPRLKAATTPPRDRISEYENALSSSPIPRGSSPAFEVKKKTWSPSDKTSPVSTLPNGKLSPNRLNDLC